MAHDHGSKGHNHAAGANSKMLAIALGLTTTFLIAELIGSFVFNSLALLSDAAHMFTDSAALAIALGRSEDRPATSRRCPHFRLSQVRNPRRGVQCAAAVRGRGLCALGRYPAVQAAVRSPIDRHADCGRESVSSSTSLP